MTADGTGAPGTSADEMSAHGMSAVEGTAPGTSAGRAGTEARRAAAVTAVPRVHGTVTTGDGWPLPGATVTVIGAAGRQLGRTVADDRGEFAVAVAAAGPVTVILAGPGLDPLARAVTVAPDRATDLGPVVLGSARRDALPAPGRWDIDPVHSIVRATARHLGLSRVDGRFTEFSGHIRVAEPVEDSAVEARIAAASITTGAEERDAHLRSADFLDAERFPALTYRSERVVPLPGNRWRVDGWLTIRDITRPAALDVGYLGTAPDPWGGTRIALVATTELARRDFEMHWNIGMPGGLVVVGPTLRVDLEIQAVHAAEPG